MTDKLAFALNESGGYTVQADNGFNSKELIIPRTYNGKPVTEIRFLGFYKCSSLISVEIPDTVVSIGSQAFLGCENLKTVIIPNSVTKIDQGVFEECKGLTSIDLPDGLTKIAHGLFQKCVGLKNISLPSGITYIEGWAFADCVGLENISLPSGVKVIGSNAFDGCTGITSISIPYGVTTIDDDAFKDCTNLRTVYLPQSITKIRGGSFRNCVNLECIYYEGSFEEWNDIDKWHGYFFGDPILWDDNTGDYVIVCSDCEIKDYAYSLNSDNNTYTIIGYKRSFEYIEQEDKVLVVNNLTPTNVVVPSFYRDKEVTSIGEYAFADCIHLSEVTIPTSVKQIGSGAFDNCSELTDINYLGTINEWDAIEKVQLLDEEHEYWDIATGDYVIHCVDGDITKQYYW